MRAAVGLALMAMLALPPSAAGQGPVAEADAGRITLDEAIRLAQTNDPATVAARSLLRTAEADLLESRGAWLPSLNLTSSYLKSSNTRVDQATGQLVSDSYTAQATASWLLFGGGRRWYEQRASGAYLAAAEAEYVAERFLTALRTTELFYEAAAAGDLLGVAEQRLARARQQNEFARARLELGTATQSDVLRAELELGNAELAVLEAQSALRNTALALGRQVGSETAVRPVPAALPERAPALLPTEELVALAVESSPAVEAAEARLRGRRADRRSGWSAYLPSLRASGGYDWTAFEWPPERRSWSMRLTASLPLFDNFAREAFLQRAGAASSAAAAAARDAVIAARVEVESAVQEIELAARRVQISDRAVELAEEDLRVLEERYQIGAATILDLQTSQVALAQAQTDAVRARQTLGTSVARLQAVLGRDLDSIDER